eukprot:659249-Alexandrium_andersonii.AAC.1
MGMHKDTVERVLREKSSSSDPADMDYSYFYVIKKAIENLVGAAHVHAPLSSAHAVAAARAAKQALIRERAEESGERPEKLHREGEDGFFARGS